MENPTARALLLSIYALGWIILLISTFLISHFELFGVQQVFQRWRGTPIKTIAFKIPAFYKCVRHPLYLGFILAFWATPLMTQGHLLFAAACTGYIFVDIFFEERDLITSFGEEYRRYRQRVPMILPFLPKHEGAKPAAPLKPKF